MQRKACQVHRPIAAAYLNVRARKPKEINMKKSVYGLLIIIHLLVFIMYGHIAMAASDEHVTIEADSGRTINGTIYIPDNATSSYPGILVLHTYYGMIHGKAENHDHDFGRSLADTGKFVALVPDYAKFGRKGYVAGITDDLISITKWLRKRPETKESSIGAVGFSTGAYHSLRLAADSPIIKAVVGYYGPYNFDIAAFSKNRRHIFPDSPVDFAPEINASVLILHGENDTETPSNQAREFASIMSKAGKVVEITVYPNAYHRFDRGPNDLMQSEESRYGHIYRKHADARNDAFQKSVRWLEINLK